MFFVCFASTMFFIHELDAQVGPSGPQGVPGPPGPSASSTQIDRLQQQLALVQQGLRALEGRADNNDHQAKSLLELIGKLQRLGVLVSCQERAYVELPDQDKFYDVIVNERNHIINNIPPEGHKLSINGAPVEFWDKWALAGSLIASSCYPDMSFDWHENPTAAQMAIPVQGETPQMTESSNFQLRRLTYHLSNIQEFFVRLRSRLAQDVSAQTANISR